MTYPRGHHPDDLYVGPAWWLAQYARVGRALTVAEARAWAQDRAHRPPGAIRRVLVVAPASALDAAAARSLIRLLLVRAACDERVPAVLVMAGRATPSQLAAAQLIVDRLTSHGERAKITLQRSIVRAKVATEGP